MMTEKESTTSQQTNAQAEDRVRDLFSVGAHYAYARSRRHPSAEPYIFGLKNRVEIFDLEKTEEMIQEVEQFAEDLGKKGGVLLFVGGKNEARKPVADHASRVGAPYVAGRWVGGTITNFSQIYKRIQKLEELEQQREKGDLSKYTKKERLMFDREIEELEKNFGSFRSMTDIPDALFIVDSKREYTAFDEARNKNIPVITLSNSDCDLSKADISIPGNDSVQRSIDYIVGRVADAYKRGQESAAKAASEKVEKEAVRS